MKKSAGGFLYCFRLFQWGGAGFESGLKNAGSLRVCFRRLVLSYRHYFPIRDGTDFQNPGLLSGFFTKRLLLKTRDGSVFKSEQPACPLPALLSVSPVLRADVANQRWRYRFSKAGTASRFFTKAVVAKTLDGSVFKSQQSAYPLPALLSVNPVLWADFIKRRKDFEMAVQVFKNGRGFSAEFAVQI